MASMLFHPSSAFLPSLLATGLVAVLFQPLHARLQHIVNRLIYGERDEPYAVRLTADLQRSREHLVTTREEERRRLRRDLHDGLSPTLASMTLKLDAARNLVLEAVTNVVRHAQAHMCSVRLQVSDGLVVEVIDDEC